MNKLPAIQIPAMNHHSAIRNSFIFLEKIGRKKEQQLWQQGITGWQAFLQIPRIKGISPRAKAYYGRRIQEAQQALLQEDSRWFVGKLPAKEMWRLYEEFKDSCCFLDIEIDQSGRVTLVGISNYYETKSLVRGINLERKNLQKALAPFKLVITFNGAAFDLPRLQKELAVEINIPHIDLKPLCVNLGLKGGLKKIERLLNLKRPAHLYGNPVELWKAFHASGDREYLELLIDYNKEDCENLKYLMDLVYGKLSAGNLSVRALSVL